ncbi:hypothetical protein J2S40_000399 [Nocardioides luteus]|uniref:Glycerophosphoryl diester phosphodiesterase membrane domain-containing protein n=1 Tax=Nocardioides luteus TaxID=1844 RepID=A0ABQ5SUB3_9ACTN|nr:hypothetical protein [Nocardioides luteus]MDR7309341.1 hypothetical protein [Nocardioides luteus]GGR50639.1 hypothetical protein GCM10010197_15640 [Nocardioides luteus]GLJ67747.1 hypothetical protein GCM10017579_17830 [Nocardioides luteus]
MAFWITSRSQEWVAAAEADDGHFTDAVWASELLKEDLLRWSRWWLGLAAFVLAFAAVPFAGLLPMMLIVEAPSGGGEVLMVLAVTAIAVLVLAAAAVVLWLLHRSGRRLARSLRWWLAVRAGGSPAQGVAGWLAPRAVLFEAEVFVRVLTASLAGLVGIFGLSLIGFSIAQNPTMIVASALWGVLGTACCIGQTGGVMRLVAGLGDADPVWNRMR